MLEEEGDALLSKGVSVSFAIVSPAELTIQGEGEKVWEGGWVVCVDVEANVHFL